jgi:hypothetical protein
MADLEAMRVMILQILAPMEVRLNARFDVIEGRLDVIEGRLDVMDGRFDSIDQQLQVMKTKGLNALVGRDDRLYIVPHEDGRIPTVNGIDFPETLGHLLVAGNQNLPGGNENSWNATKSHNLLRFYETNYDSDDDGNESSFKSREKRLRVAAAIGVTRTQWNLAQLTL